MVEYENAAMMPRPEEDREIEIEKNRKLGEDLKVNLKFTYITVLGSSGLLYRCSHGRI